MRQTDTERGMEEGREREGEMEGGREGRGAREREGGARDRQSDRERERSTDLRELFLSGRCQVCWMDDDIKGTAFTKNKEH